MMMGERVTGRWEYSVCRPGRTAGCLEAGGRATRGGSRPEERRDPVRTPPRLPPEEWRISPVREPRGPGALPRRPVPAGQPERGRVPEGPFPCWRRRKRRRPARQADRSGSGACSWRGFLQLHSRLASELPIVAYHENALRK